MKNQDKAKTALRNAQIYDDIKNELSNQANSIKEIGKLAKFWTYLGLTFMYIYKKFISVPLDYIAYFIKLVYYKPFKYLWNKFAYTNNKISYIKSSSLVAAWCVYVVLTYASLFLVWDTTLYIFTAKIDEVVYMSNAQEISANDNLHSAQGCLVTDTEKFECDESNSLYFRIEADTFAHIYSLLHNGTLFYPDYVAAPIAPGWEKCTITSYGIRAKFVMRAWDIYPALLSAKCTGEK